MGNSLPSLAAIRAAHANNPDGKLVQTDSDRIAWMDGLPVSTLLTIDQDGDKPNVEASRTLEGWSVSFFYHRVTLHRAASTWREVVDLMADPPAPKEPREILHAANPDWDDPVNARA